MLVLVGTDHHAFDRLVGWADAWASDHTGAAQVLVQRGTSAQPVAAESVEYLDHAELLVLMGRAAVIVSHGGPSTIAESRRIGTVPVVVPRDPAFGEHVDAHQLRFTRRLAEDGLVLHAVDRTTFTALLHRALADPSAVRVPRTGDDETARTCCWFGEAVAALFARS